jgi:competence protein ComEC
MIGVWRGWPDEQAKVIFCNVGQGDAVLIKKGTTQVLIDGGPGTKVMECLKKNMPPSDQAIELVVSTHPDADHLTGLISVLQEYRVHQIWVEDRVTKTKTFFRFRQILIEKKKSGSIITPPKLGDVFQIAPQMSLEVIFPFQPLENEAVFSADTTETQLLDITVQQQKQYGATNAGSIATKLTIGDVGFLFTGDLEAEQEIALINKRVLTRSNVLKAGHHGSKTSNLLPFLQEVQPETVVISVGKNNSYGHPQAQVLENFQKIGAHVHRTDKEGSIEVVSDGQNYWITSQQ